MLEHWPQGLQIGLPDFMVSFFQPWGQYSAVKHCLDFSSVFSAPWTLTCLKTPVFSKRDILWWKLPARLYWDLLTSGRYQPACHYF